MNRLIEEMGLCAVVYSTIGCSTVAVNVCHSHCSCRNQLEQVDWNIPGTGSKQLNKQLLSPGGGGGALSYSLIGTAMSQAFPRRTRHYEHPQTSSNDPSIAKTITLMFVIHSLIIKPYLCSPTSKSVVS